MEFDLIPQLVIIIGSGIVIIIFARNIPKIKDDSGDGFWSENHDEVETKEREKFRYLYNRFLNKLKKEEFKKRMDIFWIWFEKLLRKVRINFLKLDNQIVVVLEKLREKNLKKIERMFREGKTKNKTAMSEEKTSEAVEDITRDDVKKFDWKKISKETNPVLNHEANGEKAEEAPVQEIAEKKAEIAGEKDVLLSKTDTDPNVSREAKQDACEEKPHTEDVVENLGNEQKTSREKEYINMILQNPIDIKAYWQLGTIYARRKNYRDAIECFRQITKIDPTYEKARHKLSEILEKMKKSVKREKEDVSDKINEVENSDHNTPT